VASTASSSGCLVGCRVFRLVECVFDSMAATYQAPTQRQAPTPI
jgi:hypothetical protein